MNGFLFVGLAGFIAGIFLAPKKGSELREQLGDKMSKLKSAACDKKEQLKEVVTPVISQVKEEGYTLKNQGKEIVQDVHACLDKNLESGKQVLEGAQERLSEKVAPVVSLIKDDAKELGDKAHDAADKVHGKIDELKQKGSDAINDLKTKAQEKAS
jgi:gas vesicle protein